MARLPDEADEAAYEAMPIEEFGAAMLRGMGWSEGQVPLSSIFLKTKKKPFVHVIDGDRTHLAPQCSGAWAGARGRQDLLLRTKALVQGDLLAVKHLFAVGATPN